MKIIKNKFIAISTLLAATSLACCTSFAGTTNDSKQLNEIINALSSQEYTNIKLKFQNDPLLHKELLNQIENNKMKQSTNKDINSQSEASIVSNLSSIRDSIIPSQKNDSNSQSLASYTTDIPATDTPYIKQGGPNSNLLNALTANPTSSGSNMQNFATLLMPDKAKMQDQSMNFSYIFSPPEEISSYSKLATNYINFLTEPYNFKQSLTSGIPFNSLKLKIRNAKKDNDTKESNVVGTELATILNSADFRSYQLDIRHLLAVRSMATSNLNKLVAERTPMKISTGDGGQQTASPLDIEKQTATHRITDPNWYNSVQAASPASLQRRTLIVLAEIEAQNYQAHIDRERLISLESTELLMSSNQASTNLLMKKNALAKTIKKILSDGKKSS